MEKFLVWRRTNGGDVWIMPAAFGNDIIFTKLNKWNGSANENADIESVGGMDGTFFI